MINPFPNSQVGSDTILFLDVLENQTPPTISFKVAKLTPEMQDWIDMTPSAFVKSLQVEETWSDPDTFVHIIQRNRSKIALRTRRGMGNAIFASKATFDKITNIDMLSSSMNFHIVDFVPDDDCLVMYIGTNAFDVPFIYDETRGFLFNKKHANFCAVVRLAQ